MKILRVFMFMIFSFIVISNVFGKAQEAEFDWEKNEFGKVIGWIIDPETNEPVNEKFNLRFFYIDPNIDPQKPLYFKAVTDQKGFFSRNLPQGKYYVYASPIGSRKYCIEPDPYKDLENAHVIDVRNGQITKIYKKASIGSNLKVVLVDRYGQKIDIEEIFKNNSFDVSISNKEAGENICIISTENRSDDKREFFFRNIAPGKYTIKLKTSGGDIGYQKIDNIIIEKEKTTEFELIIETDTGIEGIITNENGQPLDAVWVDIKTEDGDNYIQVFTNENGYFRFIGLEEGIYNLDYFTDDENEILYGSTIRNIIIKKNVIIIKNLVLEMDKSTEVKKGAGEILKFLMHQHINRNELREPINMGC